MLMSPPASENNPKQTKKEKEKEKFTITRDLRVDGEVQAHQLGEHGVGEAELGGKVGRPVLVGVDSRHNAYKKKAVSGDRENYKQPKHGGKNKIERERERVAMGDLPSLKVLR
jgi:hypothetical protein